MRIIPPPPRKSQTPDTRRMKGLAERLRQEDAKEYTQAKLAGMFGVNRATVSRWFDKPKAKNMRNVQSHNAHNSPPPEAKPDARRVLNKAAKADILERCAKAA